MSLREFADYINSCGRWPYDGDIIMKNHPQWIDTEPWYISILDLLTGDILEIDEDGKAVINRDKHIYQP